MTHAQTHAYTHIGTLTHIDTGTKVEEKRCGGDRRSRSLQAQPQNTESGGTASKHGVDKHMRQEWISTCVKSA